MMNLLTDEECEIVAVEFCKRLGLDPFERVTHPVDTGNGHAVVMTQTAEQWKWHLEEVKRTLHLQSAIKYVYGDPIFPEEIPS